MTRALRLLASDLDGTLIAPGPGVRDAPGVVDFGRAAAAAHWTLAYITGRHLELALAGIREAGLPEPDWMGCDVGTSLYRRQDKGQYEADAGFRDRMAAAMGRQTAGMVRDALSGLAFLSLQAAERQNDFKVSYDVAEGASGDVPGQIEACLADAGLRLRVVGSRDVTQSTGLIDVLPDAAGKDATLRYLAERLGLSFDAVLFAGDSGNDRAALLSGCLGILVGNAEASFALELASAARAADLGDRLFLATKPGASGVLEGCRHFGFLPEGAPGAGP